MNIIDHNTLKYYCDLTNSSPEIFYPKRIAVIVLYWDAIKDTLEFLDSLKNKYSGDDIFLIILNNNSISKLDYSVFNDFKIPFQHITIKENLGFVGGNNLGIKLALTYNPDYILLLNNDTVLEYDIITQLLKSMDHNSEYGVMGVVNYFYNNPLSIWQAGTNINYFTGKFNVISDLERKQYGSQEIINADYVPGSAFMMRSSLLEKIGVLDYNYFAYAEEADFCYRVKKTGLKVGFINNSRILHKVGESTGTLLSSYFETRNRLFFFKNKISLFHFVLLECFLTSRYIIKILLFLLKGDNLKAHAIFLGVKDYFMGNMGKGSLNEIIKLYKKQ